MLRSAAIYLNWQKMIPRWAKVEAGETMAPEATVEASAEADMAVDVVAEVVEVDTVTTVEETEVDVDTVEAEGVDMETTVVVVVEVVEVVMVDIAEITGVMMEVWAEAGEIKALAVAWMAAVVEANFTIHNPSTRECVVAILAKPTQPLQLQPIWRNPIRTEEAATSSHNNHSQVMALLSTKLAILETTIQIMRIRALTTALFMLAIWVCKPVRASSPKHLQA